MDVYRRAGTTTTLVSQGPNGFNGAFDAEPAASTPDGSILFFLSAEQLISADSDGSIDLYERREGVTALMSRGTNGFNGAFDVVGPVRTLDDGARVVFSTEEALLANDEDDQLDIYTRSFGATTLVSIVIYKNPLETQYPARLDAFHTDADIVIFTTRQILTEEDHLDTYDDIYERNFGSMKLISYGYTGIFLPGPHPMVFEEYAQSTKATFLTTADRLAAIDTDSSADLYEISDGLATLISQGPNGFNGGFAPTHHQVSADGGQVLFTTAERLVAADTDSSLDLYVRSGKAVTERVSAGEVNGNGGADVTPWRGSGAPLFSTAEQLVAGDQDNQPDLYERRDGETRLMSTGKADPPAPVIAGTTPGSPANDNAPTVRGEAEAQSTVELFAGPSCGGAPIGTGTAAGFASPGLAIAVADDVATVVTARALDSDNNAGPCSAGFEYVEDSAPPGPPNLSGVTPQGPATDAAPTVRGEGEPGSTVRVFANATCEGTPSAVAPAAELAGGIRVPVPANAATLLSANAVDAAGNVSACSATPVTYTNDTSPPETTVARGPGAKTRDTTPTFSVRVSEAFAALSCRIDGKPARRCGPFFTTRTLRPGRHSVSFAATDLAGNADPTPATRSFRLLKKSRRRAH